MQKKAGSILWMISGISLRMAEAKPFAVLWTSMALDNALRIKNYILVNFSNREVDAFLNLLKSFETAVSVFPKLYPASHTHKNIRRAILNRNLSVFYQVVESAIIVLFVQDNRCDIKEWL